MVLGKTNPGDIFCDCLQIGLVIRVAHGEGDDLGELHFLDTVGVLRYYNISILYDYASIKAPHDLNERETHYVQS